MRSLTRRHIRFGWWSLLAFLSLGIVLETLHGFKIGWYLDTSSATRREMLTLAHAHGTLLSLIHVAFGVTLHVFAMDDANLRSARLASSCLLGASVLLPGGFFLAGFFIYGGDPGLGIFLVPVGALLLFVGVLTTAWRVTTGGRGA